MELNNLPKIQYPEKKRMGRGLGSGKGKTGGRGQKGQKARGTIPQAVVGGGLALYKKLPYRRGYSRHSRNRHRGAETVIVKLSTLNNLKAKTVVNLNSLIENKVLSQKDREKQVKVLADTELTVALIVEVPVSKKAQSLIEKAGGSVVL